MVLLILQIISHLPYKNSNNDSSNNDKTCAYTYSLSVKLITKSNMIAIVVSVTIIVKLAFRLNSIYSVNTVHTAAKGHHKI